MTSIDTVPTTDNSDDTGEADTKPPYFIRSGKTVIVHARYTYQSGPQECLGVFRATRDFDPVAEHRLFAKAYPDCGHTSEWTAEDRNSFVNWAIRGRRFLEEATPTYLFLEPWPEKPTAAAENVGDRNARG